MDDTGRAAKERVSGELTLEKAFGAYVRVVTLCCADFHDVGLLPQVLTLVVVQR